MLAAGALLRADHAIEGFFAANDQMALGSHGPWPTRGKGAVAMGGVDGIEQALEAVQRGSGRRGG
jgi:ABC-type sugar transport system substrate-binding protein